MDPPPRPPAPRGREAKVPVWVGAEEKLVSGLSRRTTCAEVVRVLLEDGRRRGAMVAAPASGPGEDRYCLVERWRGLERALPAQTRLLRLWGAWAASDEKEHVQFHLLLLRRRRRRGPEEEEEAGGLQALVDGGARTAEARVVPSSGKSSLGGAPTALRPAPSSSSVQEERQRRVVRKAFRKLAKLNRRKGGGPVQAPKEKKEEEGEREEGPEGCSSSSSPSSSSSSSSLSRMESLVSLVLSQDQTLRLQGQRLRELDGEIERYEARLHLERMRRHGVNYVQETYLEPQEQDPEEEEGEKGEKEEGEEGEGPLPRRWAALAALAEERSRQEALGESLAAQIQEELNRRWMRRRRQELARVSSSSSSPSEERDCETTELQGGEKELPAEEERLRTQLSASLYIGLRLSTDLDAVQKALLHARRAREEKEEQLRRLLRDLDGGGGGEEDLEEEEEEEEGEASPPEPSGKVEEEEEEEEEDSDTGLSSMHSQDSDSGPGGASESLV